MCPFDAMYHIYHWGGGVRQSSVGCKRMRGGLPTFEPSQLAVAVQGKIEILIMISHSYLHNLKPHNLKPPRVHVSHSVPTRYSRL